MWIVFAFCSALFAGLTSILAKCGIKKTDSTVATAIRTIVVLLFLMADGAYCRLGKRDRLNNAALIDFFLFYRDLRPVQAGFAISKPYSSEI